MKIQLREKRVIGFYIMIICKIEVVAITGVRIPLRSISMRLTLNDWKLKKVPVVMVSKILVGHQAKYDEVRKRAIVYPVEVLGCNVRRVSEVLVLNFRIR